jgi:hypothetical protein
MISSRPPQLSRSVGRRGRENKMRYSVSIFLALFLIGCSGLHQYKSTPVETSQSNSVTSSSEQIAFLQNAMITQKCRNACWFGIEPEITDPNNVREILVIQYGDKNVDIPSKKYLSAGWKTNDNLFPQHGSVVISEKGVVEISVFFENHSITFENFITAIGQPEVVLISGAKTPEGFRCDGIWGVLYPKIGLEVLVTLSDDIGTLEKSQNIGYIGIIKPWTPNENNWLVREYTSKLVEWNGFGDYCPNSP